MHELAVCQALIEEVEAIAENARAGAVTDIHVGIGPLSGIEWALLRDAFPIAAAGSKARDARLHLHRKPVTVHCNECGRDSAAAANRLLCAYCNNWRTQLVGGDELLLERVCLEHCAEEID